MPFPDSPRVIYKQNPLIDVVCQFRFPRILKIDTEKPAAFQDSIRERFPIFEEKDLLARLPNTPPDLAEKLKNSIPIIGAPVSYDFVSTDGKWRIGLTSEFISFSTLGYKRWEEFKEYFEEAYTTFIELYKPSFFIRIGLRYRDLIERSKLNLVNERWGDLLAPYIVSELNQAEISDDIIGIWKQMRVKLKDDNAEVVIQHGIVLSQENSENSEFCYLIDSDFYSLVQMEANSDAFKKLDFYNRKAGQLFRWCITERLHQALEPDSV